MGAKHRLEKQKTGSQRPGHWLKENPSVLAALITAVGTIAAALLSKIF